MRTLQPILSAAVLLATATTASAALSITLPGNSEESIWQDMNATNYGASTGVNYGTATNPWLNPIAPDSGSALFDKVSGGGYPASASIYNTDVSGSYAITDSAPISDLATLVFQIDQGAFTGEAPIVPVLSYNGGSQALVADYTLTTAGDYDNMGSPSVLLAFQWDLSGILDPITSYTIDWTSGVHGSNFYMQINTGDTFAQVVPEPSTYALIAGLGVAGLLIFRRKRRS